MMIGSIRDEDKKVSGWVSPFYQLGINLRWKGQKEGRRGGEREKGKGGGV